MNLLKRNCFFSQCVRFLLSLPAIATPFPRECHWPGASPSRQTEKKFPYWRLVMNDKFDFLKNICFLTYSEPSNNKEFKSKEFSMARMKYFILFVMLLTSCQLHCETVFAKHMPNKRVGEHIEIGSPALIVQYFIPIPEYEIGDGSREAMISMYKKTVRDMYEFGANAVSLDIFDGQRDKTNVVYFIEAVRQFNKENSNANFAYFINLDMNFHNINSWPAESIINTFNLTNGPDYALFNGKPILSTWQGDQKGMRFWINEICTPLKKAGNEPFLYCMFMKYKENNPDIDRMLGYYNEIKKAGFEIAYYQWACAESSKTIKELEMIQQSFSKAGIRATPGFSSSFWATVASGNASLKPNAGDYKEHFGYESTDKQLRAVLPGGPFEKQTHLWVTIWNDIGEDNCFSPNPNPTRDRKAPEIEVWTHRGFYEYCKRYITWFKNHSEPPITKDMIFWAYRQHPKDLPTQQGDIIQPSIKINTSEMIDCVFFSTVLTAPATLKFALGNTVYNVNANAGVQHHRLLWKEGRGFPKFEIVRNGNTIIKATGTVEITDNPKGTHGVFTRNFRTYADFARSE